MWYRDHGVTPEGPKEAKLPPQNGSFAFREPGLFKISEQQL
jgi:hypothetical protein